MRSSGLGEIHHNSVKETIMGKPIVIEKDNGWIEGAKPGSKWPPFLKGWGG